MGKLCTSMHMEQGRHGAVFCIMQQSSSRHLCQVVGLLDELTYVQAFFQGYMGTHSADQCAV